ncbi:MAG: leucine-rich repeat protein [Clostridiales bacterium]|nr:leucine-rich repeat protein [Clostridiales bacterium]
MQTVLKKKLPIILVPVLLILIVLFFETIASAETYLDPVSGIRWVYTINDDDTCTITSSSYASGVVVIPEKIGSYKVTALGAGGMNNIFGGNSNNTVTSVTIPNSVIAINDGAFRSSKMLESVNIPDSVEFIGQFAFYNCTELTSITIPNSVTTISFGAFQYCSKLESVIIPDSIISIGPQVFCDCTSLTNVTIPRSVISIDVSAFFGCSSLTAINVNYENENYTSVDGILFNKDKTVLLRYPHAKAGSEYIVPDYVNSIGSNAFQDCGTQLNSIVIPDTAAGTIGEYAFDGCLGLESVTIGNSITLIDTRAFWECTNLKSVIIGNSVTSIGTDAFEDCTNLETVVLGNSVETIGDRAFYNCQKLQSINFPESVRVIMFSSFYGCTSFESVVIPDTVETLEAYVFNDCTNLESAEIHANITSLEDGLFRGCTSLTSVTIPDTVTSFGDDTFHNCTSLASITIPDNVTSIGSYTFCGCTSLTSVTIPDSVTSIGEYAFNGCTNLASINLPKAITSLSNSLFWGCTSLTSITIPASVTSIGSYAFYDCTSLTSIYFKGDAPTFERNALPETELITLHYSDKKNWTVTGGKFWANEYDFNYYNAVADMPAVIFNSNGGTDVPLQVLMHGEKAVRPTNPTKEGLTFVAWYRDADFNTLWDFDNDTIGDTDITLYAMWMLSDEVFAVGDPLHLRSQFMNLTQIQPYHISVDCHLAKIGAHILRTV